MRVNLDKLIALVNSLMEADGPVKTANLAEELGLHIATVRNYLRILRYDLQVDIPHGRQGLLAPRSLGKLSGFFETG